MSTLDQPEPPRHGPRTELIVLITIAALLVIGGAVTTLILLTRPPSAKAGVPNTAMNQVGRYHTPPTCDRLNGGPFTFRSAGKLSSRGDVTIQECAGLDSSFQGMAATIEMFAGADGVEGAQDIVNLDIKGTRTSAAGFENAPFLAYPEGVCMVEYNRSNEIVQLMFNDLPGVTDLASCQRVGIPVARQYYQLIG